MSEHGATKMNLKVGMKSSIVSNPYVTAAIAELKDEWGFEATSEMIAVAVRYAANATRHGLDRIEFDQADGLERQ